MRLSLTDPGFDHTVLSEFRSRLIEGKAEQHCSIPLDRLRDLGLVKPRGRHAPIPRTCSRPGAVQRLERVGETLRAALNEVAVMARAWLQALAPPSGMSAMPAGSRTIGCRRRAARQDLAAAIGPTDVR